MEEQTFIKKKNKSKNNFQNVKPLKLKYKLFNNNYFYNIVTLILILLMMLSTLFIKNKNMKYKQFINECKQLKRFNILNFIVKIFLFIKYFFYKRLS